MDHKGNLNDSYIPSSRMTVRVVEPLIVEATMWLSGLCSRLWITESLVRTQLEVEFSVDLNGAFLH